MKAISCIVNNFSYCSNHFNNAVHIILMSRTDGAVEVLNEGELEKLFAFLMGNKENFSDVSVAEYNEQVSIYDEIRQRRYLPPRFDLVNAHFKLYGENGREKSELPFADRIIGIVAESI